MGLVELPRQLRHVGVERRAAPVVAQQEEGHQVGPASDVPQLGLCMCGGLRDEERERY